MVLRASPDRGRSTYNSQPYPTGRSPNTRAATSEALSSCFRVSAAVALGGTQSTATVLRGVHIRKVVSPVMKFVKMLESPKTRCVSLIKVYHVTGHSSDKWRSTRGSVDARMILEMFPASARSLLRVLLLKLQKMSNTADRCTLYPYGKHSEKNQRHDPSVTYSILQC